MLAMLGDMWREAGREAGWEGESVAEVRVRGGGTWPEREDVGGAEVESSSVCGEHIVIFIYNVHRLAHAIIER